MKFGVYGEYVSNAQPLNNNSNGFVHTATWQGGSTGNSLADMLMGGPIAAYNESSKNIVADMSYKLFEAYAQDSWKIKPRLTVDYGVRFSYFGPWGDNNGIGMAAWDASKYGDGSGSFPGVVWNQKDSSVPLSGVEGNWFFATPRVGFAWDTKGNGETVVRGGVGMYRYHEPQLIWSGLMALPAGQKAYDAPGGLTLQGIEALAGAGNLVFGGSTIDLGDNKQPLAYNWSLTLNQKMPWSMNVELGYVGNSQKNLLNNDIANLNAIPLGALPNDSITVDENAYRPLLAYGDLQVYRHSAYANYHGLQALLSRQRGSFNFTAAYTFSKLARYPQRRWRRPGRNVRVPPASAELQLRDPRHGSHARRDPVLQLAAEGVQGQRGAQRRPRRLAARRRRELRERRAHAGRRHP